MFQFFQKLLAWLRSLFFHKEMDITLIGLQNAGKTTLIDVLTTGSFKEDQIPTIGFNVRRVKKGGVTIKVWDIGGQARFRTMWEGYCRTAKAIVYMVDSADKERIEESKEALKELFEDQHENPTLFQIPLLILGNKNDLENCLTADELKEKLELSSINDREIEIMSISCKNSNNLDKVLSWLTDCE